MIVINLKDGITYNTNSLKFSIDGKEVHKNDVIRILKEKYKTRARLLREFFMHGSGGQDKTKSPLFMKNVGKEILRHFPH